MRAVWQPELHPDSDDSITLLVHSREALTYNRQVSDTDKKPPAPSAETRWSPHSGGTNCITCKGEGWVCEDHLVRDACYAMQILPCPACNHPDARCPVCGNKLTEPCTAPQPAIRA